MEFGHERLDVYRLAVEVARWAAKVVFPPLRKNLRDQLIRATESVALNVAEGAGQIPGDARRNHFRIALGSAAESCSVLDLVDLPGGREKQGELRRIGAMLSKMGRA